MTIDNNQQLAFFNLLQAGLWEDVSMISNLSIPQNVDWAALYHLAEKQGVVGLVAAGLDRMKVNIPKTWALQFIGAALQIEQKNKAMNAFIADIISKMREADIKTLLVKGQGLAQCYEKPLWRSSGDVDFLLDDSNYERAVKFMLPLSSNSKPEGKYSKHIGMDIGQWYVELHGTLRTNLSARVDKEIDAVHKDTFENKHFREWQDDDMIVLLPEVNNDVFFVFTHLIKHFYKEGGVTLRQLCDWCRLLWTFRDALDLQLLDLRINRAGLMNEWKVFSAVAVEWLGMPSESMPFWDSKIRNKGARLVNLILRGNVGSEMEYAYQLARIFPRKTFAYLPSIFLNVNWLKIKERLFAR